MDGTVTHMVWMKIRDDATEEQIKFWIEKTAMLRDIPGVIKVEAGILCFVLCLCFIIPDMYSCYLSSMLICLLFSVLRSQFHPAH
jgi:hypothetical protein